MLLLKALLADETIVCSEEVEGTGAFSAAVSQLVSVGDLSLLQKAISFVLLLHHVKLT